MAEEIPVSSVALAKGKNESNDPDDVAVEEENTSDKDLVIYTEIHDERLHLQKKNHDLKAKKIQDERLDLQKNNHDLNAELLNHMKMCLDLQKKIHDTQKKIHDTQKEFHDSQKKIHDLQNEFHDLQIKKIHDLNANERAVGMAPVGVAVGAFALVTVYFFQQQK